MKIVILYDNDLKVVHILFLFNRNVLEYSKRPKDPKIFSISIKKRTNSPVKIPPNFFSTTDRVKKKEEKKKKREKTRKDLGL